jgi:hypothetical protein
MVREGMLCFSGGRVQMEEDEGEWEEWVDDEEEEEW